MVAAHGVDGDTGAFEMADFRAPAEGFDIHVRRMVR